MHSFKKAGSKVRAFAWGGSKTYRFVRSRHMADAWGKVLRPVRTGYRADGGRRDLVGSFVFVLDLLWRWSLGTHVVTGHHQHLLRLDVKLDGRITTCSALSSGLLQTRR